MSRIEADDLGDVNLVDVKGVPVEPVVGRHVVAASEDLYPQQRKTTSIQVPGASDCSQSPTIPSVERKARPRSI
jgi:hypothetical protein